MAPGPQPKYPEKGTLEEMTELYLDTVQKYAECEDRRATIVVHIKQVQEELAND